MSTVLGTPWTAACHVPLFIGFPRQEHWNGLPFPSTRDLPDPGIESKSPALASRFFFCFFFSLQIFFIGKPCIAFIYCISNHCTFTFMKTLLSFSSTRKLFQECREISNLNSEKVHHNYYCIAVVSAFSVFLK